MKTPNFRTWAPVALLSISLFGCGSETAVPDGADFSDPSKPVKGAKPAESKPAGGPAASEAEGRAILEGMTKRGRS